MSESRGYRDFEGFALERAQEERSWSELGPDLPEYEHECSGYCNFWPPETWWDPDGWEDHEE